MRFLADENFPGSAVAELRRNGHEVNWIREVAPGATDEQVIGQALGAGAVLLTFDKDFGELTWRMRMTEGFGVILFRTPIGERLHYGNGAAADPNFVASWT